MNLGALAAALAGLVLLTGCDSYWMPQRPVEYAPWEEGLTLGYENPGLPADLRLKGRYQVRVKTSRPGPAGRVVVETTTTLTGENEATYLHAAGGVSLGSDPDGRTRILPKGFPDRTDRWEDRGIFHWVVGRAYAPFPGLRLAQEGNPLGVWVESAPVHALGPRWRTLYLPDIGEAETLVWKDGQWHSVFRLVSRGFTDAPPASLNHGVPHE
jgi:hypothetical protein